MMSYFHLYKAYCQLPGPISRVVSVITGIFMMCIFTVLYCDILFTLQEKHCSQQKHKLWGCEFKIIYTSSNLYIYSACMKKGSYHNLITCIGLEKEFDKMAHPYVITSFGYFVYYHFALLKMH